MVITRTPFRISLFGGGTDYPAWYREHGGAVLAAGIDKYCYLTCRRLPPFFEHKFRVVYSKIENSQTIDEIKHPSVREVLRYLNCERGVEIHHDGDLPARSGMGSSSSFTVGLLHAIHALSGRIQSNEQLALEAIHLEQNILKETVGSQDQVTAAYGGFNHIQFHQNDTIAVEPITIPQPRMNELCRHLMLFYTGIKRTASSVADSYVPNIDEKEKQLRSLSGLVTEAISLLNSDHDLDQIGSLLHESWSMKRSLSTKVSNGDVDDIYALARSAGALGGKLTGAGGGGFLLLFAPLDKKEHIKQKLGKLIHVPFEFDFTGSRVIFYDQGSDFTEAETDRARQSQLEQFRELDPTSSFD